MYLFKVKKVKMEGNNFDNDLVMFIKKRKKKCQKINSI